MILLVLFIFAITKNNSKENIIILLAVKFPLTIECLGETCVEIPVFLGVPTLTAALKKDFIYHLKTPNLNLDLSRNYGEGLSKTYLLQQQYIVTGDIVQDYTKNMNIKLFFPKETPLNPYFGRGGDVIYQDQNKVICAELKFKFEELKSYAATRRYITEKIIDKYSVNEARPIVTIIDCSSTLICKNIYNYINNITDIYGNPKIFTQEELQLITLEELKAFDRKAGFKHLIIADKSFFFDRATQEDVNFKKACLESVLKNENFMQYFNNKIRTPFLENFGNGKFEINKTVDEDVDFFYNRIKNERKA